MYEVQSSLTADRATFVYEETREMQEFAHKRGECFVCSKKRKVAEGNLTCLSPAKRNRATVLNELLGFLRHRLKELGFYTIL